jgi:putative nucleotidyltransferase with HDIG domain
MAFSPQTGTRLSEQVSRMRDLPTLSLVIRDVLRLVQGDRAGAAQLAQALKRDQVLTAKILRMANSGYHARAVPITDVKKALSFLGDQTVAALALTTSAFTPEDLAQAHWFNAEEFWKHSLAVAVVAERLAEKVPGAKPDECFTCGLLHDLGKMALFRADREIMAEIVHKALNEGISFLQAEQALGLPGHNVLGERLAQQWNLPLVVRKAIRYQHRDITGMESLYAEMRVPVMLTSVANWVAKREKLGFSGDLKLPELPASYLPKMALTERDLDEARERLEDEMELVRIWMSQASQRRAA